MVRLQLLSSLSGVNPTALIAAINQFIADTGLTIDADGFKERTVAAIANATILDKGGDFWIATREDASLAAYLLAEHGVGCDGTPTYFMNQCWLANDVRGKGLLREWFGEVTAHARARGAKNIVMVSSRNADAYCRLLGIKKPKFTTLIEF